MNCSDLSEATRLFLNKAMDIYSVIKDKSLNSTVTDIIYKTQDYEFTKLDKKVLALFICFYDLIKKTKRINNMI